MLLDVFIFTDGSCKGQGNNKRAGYGCYFPHDETLNISKKIKKGKITNQVAELKACIKGIEKIISNDIIDGISIFTDSMYVINSICVWAEEWSKNNWKKNDGSKIKNKKLIKKLWYYYNNFNIDFAHIKAHSKKPTDINSKEYKLWYGNYMADKLANEGADL